MGTEPRLKSDKYKSFFATVKKDLSNTSHFSRTFAPFDEEVKEILDRIDNERDTLTKEEWNDFLTISIAKDDVSIPYKILTTSPNLPDDILISALMSQPSHPRFVDVLNTPKSDAFLDYCANQTSFILSLKIALSNFSMLNQTTKWVTNNACNFDEKNINYILQKMLNNPNFEYTDVFQFFTDEKIAENWFNDALNFEQHIIESVNTSILNNGNLSSEFKNRVFNDIDFVLEDITFPTPELATHIYDILTETIDDKIALSYKAKMVFEEIISNWTINKTLPESLQKDYVLRCLNDYKNHSDLSLSAIRNILMHTTSQEVIAMAHQFPEKVENSIYYNPNISKKEAQNVYQKLIKDFNKQSTKDIKDIELNSDLILSAIAVSEFHPPTVEQAFILFLLNDSINYDIVDSLQKKCLYNEKVDAKLLKLIAEHSNNYPNLSPKSPRQAQKLNNSFLAKIRLNMEEAGFSHEEYKEINLLFRKFAEIGNSDGCYNKVYYDNLNEVASLIEGNNKDYVARLDKLGMVPDFTSVNIREIDKLINLLKCEANKVENEEYKHKVLAFANAFIVAKKHNELNETYDPPKNTLHYLRKHNTLILSNIINRPNKQPTDLYDQIDEIASKYVEVAKEIKKREKQIMKETLSMEIKANLR